MKSYNPKVIRESEVLQLLILHSLYSQRKSREIIFQGGTALRWCYNSGRFSEDLDFITPLGREDLLSIMTGISPMVERGMVAHFGPGKLDVNYRDEKRTGYHVVDFRFIPQNMRRKVYVKVEFEELKEGFVPDNEKVILGMLPSVRQLINEGVFKLPVSTCILVVETPEEILSDKVRALLERRYIKGRDLYDLWFLVRSGVKCNVSVLERKFLMYRSPFRARRNSAFFIKQSGTSKRQIIEALRADLSRFLPLQEYEYHEEQKFRDILQALKEVFSEIEGVLP